VSGEEGEEGEQEEEEAKPVKFKDAPFLESDLDLRVPHESY
jgi:hypothetical protein